METKDTCHVCGQSGHWASKCPNKALYNRQSGGQQKSGKYDNNHDNSDSERDGQYASKNVSDITCYNCNKKGHYSRACPNETGGRSFKRQDNYNNDYRRNDRFSGDKNSQTICYVCQNPGHFARECPNKAQNEGWEGKDRRSDAYEGSRRREPRGEASDVSQVTCYKCGNLGHYANKCQSQEEGSKFRPTDNNRREGDSGRRSNYKSKDLRQVTCFNCNQTGHYARNCAEAEGKPAENQDDRTPLDKLASPDVCAICHYPGRLSKTCSHKEQKETVEGSKDRKSENYEGSKSRGARGDVSQITCYKCRNVGHYASKCPTQGDERRQGGERRYENNHDNRGDSDSERDNTYGSKNSRNVTCFNCNKTGHYARNCSTAGEGKPFERRAKDSNDLCYVCQLPGHIARACPNREEGEDKKGGENQESAKLLSQMTCYKCGNKGHFANKCSSLKAK